MVLLVSLSLFVRSRFSICFLIQTQDETNIQTLAQYPEYMYISTHTLHALPRQFQIDFQFTIQLAPQSSFAHTTEMPSQSLRNAFIYTFNHQTPKPTPSITCYHRRPVAIVVVNSTCRCALVLEFSGAYMETPVFGENSLWEKGLTLVAAH